MLNCDDTAWHTTGVPGDGPDIVRVTLYLDESTAEQGALHVMPGTHCLEYSRTLFQALGYWQGRAAPDPGADAIAAEKVRRIAQSSRSTIRPYLYGDLLAAQLIPVSARWYGVWKSSVSPM